MTDPSPGARPTAAGRYDYLGGTAHPGADRAAAEQVVQVIPPLIDSAGSYLALSHGSTDRQMSKELKYPVSDIYVRTATPPADRTKLEIAEFFRGLDVVPRDPGAAPEVTFLGLWEAEDPEAADTEWPRWFYAAVARTA